jgi:hypothetical protein
MGLTVLGAFALSAALAPLASAATPPASVFDTATSVDTVIVPAKGQTPKTTVTCHYYPKFMVKQVDEGEVGAAQLSIAPSDAAHKPACQRANAANEKVVNPGDWSGYFKGVKGDYVFFNAGDGTNGAMGFAVFGSDAKKLFVDSALGEFKSLTLDGSKLTINYQRSVAGACSVVKDGASCWTKIATATGVAASPAPDCAGGYLKAKNAMAKGRCEADQTPTEACTAKALKVLDEQRWNEAPSVIVFEAQTVLAAGKATTTASGPALICHPSD